MKNLKPHNLEWKGLFEKETELLKDILKDEVVDTYHIGSTAIPGILSKPIIDIVILVKSFETISYFFDELEKIGYKYSKERSSSERYFLTKENATRYHLSIANPKTPYLKRQIMFRDYLINHPKIAKEYEDLKIDLIKKYPSGKDEYSYGKSEFINKILKKAKKEILNLQTF
ncbi:GrpB family protein [Patescibacteria group bacterium]|nr:GrpB family protein [Patescibacteria group bacterium]